MVRTFVIAFVFLGLGLARAQEADTAKDLKGMQGTWLGEVREASGAPISDKLKGVQPRIVIKGDKYVVFLNDMKYTEGSIKLDAGKKPKTIDSLPTDGPYKGMLQPGIYEITGDDMRVVFTKPGAERPGEFKTRKDTEEVLIQYKRVKDAK